MPHDDLEELLQTRPAALDHVVAKPVGEHLAGKRGDGHAGALPLKDVAEVLKVRIAAAHRRLPQLEGGDVGATYNLVVGVHVAADTVGSGVADLFVGEHVSEVRSGALGVVVENGHPTPTRVTRPAL